MAGKRPREDSQPLRRSKRLQTSANALSQRMEAASLDPGPDQIEATTETAPERPDVLTAEDHQSFAGEYTHRFLFRAGRGNPQQDDRAFTTWIPSLSAALETAQRFFDANEALEESVLVQAAGAVASGDIYVSIIDTSRLAPPTLVRPSEASLRVSDDSIQLSEDEYLVIGSVPDAAGSSVRYKRFTEQDTSLSFSDPDWPPETLFALQLGALFGPAFELPISAYLLAAKDQVQGRAHTRRIISVLNNRKRRRELVDALSTYKVPGDWTMDEMIMRGEDELGDPEDVRRFYCLLWALVGKSLEDS